MSFGFDPSIILSALKSGQPPSVNDTLQTVSNLATQGTQQAQGQAQLADLLRRQDQEKTLADVYRGNADTPGDLPAALMRGGFGPQAYAAQDQASQMQTQEATRAKLVRDIQDAQRKKVGDLFYGTKDDADYQGRLKQLAADPDQSVAMYAHMLPPKHDPAVTEYLGNLAVPAVERAKLAAKGNGAGQVIVGEDGTQYVANKQTGAATAVKDEAGNAIKARPKGRVGAAGGAGGAGAADQLSPEAVDAMAQKFNTTGELTGLGMGKAAMGLKIRIMNRAMELKPGADLAGNAAGYKADKASLTKLQAQADFVDSFENTASKNLDTFLELAKGIQDTGSPYLNAPVRKLEELGAGDPKLAALNTALTTASTEIGKVLSGSTGNAALTEGAREEVKHLLRPDATLGQWLESAKVLKQDMANRKASVRSGLDEIRGRISGKPASAEGRSKAAAPVRIKSDADYDALPSGAAFIDPDGKHRRKP